MYSFQTEPNGLYSSQDVQYGYKGSGSRSRIGGRRTTYAKHPFVAVPLAESCNPCLSRPAPRRIQILEAVNFDRVYVRHPFHTGGDKK